MVARAGRLPFYDTTDPTLLRHSSLAITHSAHWMPSAQPRAPGPGRGRTNEHHNDGQRHVDRQLARRQRAPALAVAVHVADDHAALAGAAGALGLQRGGHGGHARLCIAVRQRRLDLVLTVRLPGAARRVSRAQRARARASTLPALDAGTLSNDDGRRRRGKQVAGT